MIALLQMIHFKGFCLPLVMATVGHDVCQNKSWWSPPQAGSSVTGISAPSDQSKEVEH
jgi:hypothetical protein